MATLDDAELLDVLASERDHHPAARRELVEQRTGHLLRGGGDQDAIERRVLGPAARPVADADADAVAERAPFDGVLVTAAGTEPPAALLEQLKPGGRMVVPLGGQEVQQLSVVERGRGEDHSVRRILPVRFTRLETA